MTVDCGDHICQVHFEYALTCQYFYESDDKPKCKVPCDMSTCRYKLYHEVRCPFWSCSDKPTTTSSPPITTQPPTPSPPLPSAGSCSSSACIAAVSFNAIFCVALVILIVLYLRNRRQQRSATQEEMTPIFNPGRRSSVRSQFSVENEFAQVDLNAPTQNDRQNEDESCPNIELRDPSFFQSFRSRFLRRSGPSRQQNLDEAETAF